MKLLTKFNKAFDLVVRVFAIMGALLLAFIMFSVCTDVIMRYFFSKPMLWVIEITEYCILWLTFLGTAWVLSREGHVVMDLMISHMRPGSKSILNIITSIVGLAVCLLLTWYGVKVILDVYQRELLLSTILTPPAYLLFLIIPIGFFLLTVQFIRRTINLIIKRRTFLSEKNGAEDSAVQTGR
ncbi:TRAP transporter small permease [Thermodesulfobacteriota bacterium]